MLLVTAVVSPAQDVRAGGCDNIAAVETRTINPQQTNWNELVTIPKFDPAQGTLCFVVVRMSASFEAAVIAQNLSNHTAMLTATVTDQVKITPPAPIMMYDHTESITNDVRSVPAFGSTVWSIGSTTFTKDQTFDMGLGAFLAAAPGDTLDFNASGMGSFKVGTDSGNARVKGTVLAGATIEVTYYTPEPSSLLLLAAGLAVVTRRSRRRRA